MSFDITESRTDFERLGRKAARITNDDLLPKKDESIPYTYDITNADFNGMK